MIVHCKLQYYIDLKNLRCRWTTWIVISTIVLTLSTFTYFIAICLIMFGVLFFVCLQNLGVNLDSKIGMVYCGLCSRLMMMWFYRPNLSNFDLNNCTFVHSYWKSYFTKWEERLSYNLNPVAQVPGYRGQFPINNYSMCYNPQLSAHMKIRYPHFYTKSQYIDIC